MIAELYRFRVGALTFAYTNNQTAIVEGSTTYEPSYIQRDEIKNTTTVARTALTIRIPRDAELVNEFVAFPPTSVPTVEIFAKDGANDPLLIYKGRIMNVPREGSEVLVNCESIMTSIIQSGLKKKFQKQCPYALYDQDCTVNKVDFQVTGVLSAVNAEKTEITAPEFDTAAADFFVGGFIEVGSLPERRYVVDQKTGGVLVLQTVLEEALVGVTVQAFAGCKHTFAVCRDKFSNELNFGGFPFIPTKNPFGNDLLF